jgi:hypothetical protein
MSSVSETKNNDMVMEDMFLRENAEYFWGTDVDFAGRQAILKFVETRCARCDSPMICQPEGDCWCKELPALPMPAENSGCLCRDCLKSEWKEKDAEING